MRRQFLLSQNVGLYGGVDLLMIGALSITQKTVLQVNRAQHIKEDAQDDKVSFDKCNKTNGANSHFVISLSSRTSAILGVGVLEIH